MKDNTKEIQRLMVYTDKLRQQLSSQPPERHSHRPAAYAEMLRIDLKKTLRKIETLK